MHLTEAQRVEIVRLYTEEHLSGPQIQQRLGIGQHRSVYRVLEKAGIERPKTGLADPATHDDLMTEIVRLYKEQQMTGPEIKAQLGIKSVTTVYAALRQAGIRRPRRGPREAELSAEAEALAKRVVDLWNKGLMGPEIKEELKSAGIEVPFVSLYRMLRAAGIEPSKSGRREREIAALTEREEVELLRLHSLGVSRNKMAERFNCSPYTIRGFLKGLGFEGARTVSKHPQRQTRKERVSLSNGYVAVHVPPDSPFASMRSGNLTDLVLEHRVVMAQQLNRPLIHSEEVHHRDGNRSNNDPSNLELWIVHQPRGQRAIDMMRYFATYFPHEMRAMLDGEEVTL